MQIVATFICLLQLGAICMQYSHDERICYGNIHLAWDFIYNIHYQDSTNSGL